MKMEFYTQTVLFQVSQKKVGNYKTKKGMELTNKSKKTITKTIQNLSER